jgi:uncharacterized protein (DUF1684 family)
MKTILIIAVAALASLTSCTKPSSGTMTAADSLKAVNETLDYRRTAEEYFRHEKDSPFNTEPAVPFEGLRWFPPDPGMYFTAKLERYERPETVIVYGTKKEPRKQLRYGYFTLQIEGKVCRINVYKFPPEITAQHPELDGVLSAWFTDETTGRETYHVGRYLQIEPESKDPGHLYVLNLNNAHNPYCAYNPVYSCAIPTREDRLPVAIRAGEMNYREE